MQKIYLDALISLQRVLLMRVQLCIPLATFSEGMAGAAVSLLPCFLACKGLGNRLVVRLPHGALAQHVLKTRAERLTASVKVLQPVLHLDSRIACMISTFQLLASY